MHSDYFEFKFVCISAIALSYKSNFIKIDFHCDILIYMYLLINLPHTHFSYNFSTHTKINKLHVIDCWSTLFAVEMVIHRTTTTHTYISQFIPSLY